MKFYLQVQVDGTITDAIEYSHGNYTEYEAESLPIGVNGGWFKLENGVIVEYPELKPLTPEDEIAKLTTENTALQLVQTQMSTDFQALTDLLAQLGVI